MTLRTKLLVAFAYLALLIIVTAILSAIAFKQVNDELGDILAFEERTIVAVESALDGVLSSIAQKQLAEGVERTDLENGLAAELSIVREEVSAALETERSQIVIFEEQVRRLFARTGVQFGLLVALALISMVLLAVALQKEVLQRLAKLRRFTDAVLAGEDHLRLRLEGRDELASLARQLNETLDQQQAMHSRVEGRLNQQRTILVGILALLDRPVALVSFDGFLLASSLVEEDESCLIGQEIAIRKLRDRIPSDQGVENLEELDKYEAYEIGGQFYVFALMTASRNRPVCWVVVPSSNTEVPFG